MHNIFFSRFFPPSAGSCGSKAAAAEGRAQRSRPAPGRLQRRCRAETFAVQPRLGPGQSPPRPLAPRRTTIPTTDAPSRSPRCGAQQPKRGNPATVSRSAGSCGPGRSSARQPRCRGLAGAGARTHTARCTRTASGARHGAARPHQLWCVRGDTMVASQQRAPPQLVAP